MKKVVLSLAVMSAWAGLPAIAQPPQHAASARNFSNPAGRRFQAGDEQPAGQKVSRSQLRERRVRARVVAPQAQSVMLDLAGIKYPADQGGRRCLGRCLEPAG